MASERVKVFDVSPKGEEQINGFLARPDIQVDKIMTAACHSGYGAYHFVTVVYWQLETPPSE